MKVFHAGNFVKTDPVADGESVTRSRRFRSIPLISSSVDVRRFDVLSGRFSENGKFWEILNVDLIRF
jgi:hypothetical protein